MCVVTFFAFQRQKNACTIRLFCLLQKKSNYFPFFSLQKYFLCYNCVTEILRSDSREKDGCVEFVGIEFPPSRIC